MPPMKLTNILQIATYKYKDSRMVCFIKVLPRPISYYHGQKKPPKVLHWMSAEHWSLFDAGMERLLDKYTDNKKQMIDETFLMNPLIQVSVKKSKMRSKDVTGFLEKDQDETRPLAGIFSCVIEYSNDGVWQNSPCLKTKDEPLLANNNGGASLDLNISELEYTPQFISNSNTEVVAPSYVPSTCPSDNVVIQTDDEEAYCPLISPSIPDIPTDANSPTKSVPKYSPTRIKYEQTALLAVIEEDEEIIESSQGSDQQQDKSKTMIRNENEGIECTPIQQSVSVELPRPTDDDDDLAAFEIKSDKDKSKTKRRNTTDIALSKTSPRRKSPRAIVIPARYTPDDFQTELPQGSKSSNPKPSQSSKKTKLTKQMEKELFEESSDDEENEHFQKNILNKQIHAIKTPKRHEDVLNVKNNHSSSNSSSKRKRNKNSPPSLAASSATSSSSKNCEQEKNKMSKWLGKKTHHSSSRERESTSSSSQKTSSSIVHSSHRKRKLPERYDQVQLNLSISPDSLASNHRDINSLTKEELQRKIEKDRKALEDNKILNKELESLKGPDPIEVEMRYLTDLTKCQVMESFLELKSILDDIFLKLKHKNNISSYDGNDHFTVIDLIDNDIQLMMMEKLSDSYEEKDKDADGIGVAKYTKLYVNALLPEWILRMFMKKFKLNRTDALQHIRAQKEYKMHIADIGLADSSFSLMDSL